MLMFEFWKKIYAPTFNVYQAAVVWRLEKTLQRLASLRILSLQLKRLICTAFSQTVTMLK